MSATKTKKAPARKTIAARRTSKTTQTEKASSPALSVDTRTIREWAMDKGHLKSARGPLPQRIIDLYNSENSTVAMTASSGKTRTPAVKATSRKRPTAARKPARKVKAAPQSDEQQVLSRLSASNPDLADAVNVILAAVRAA